MIVLFSTRLLWTVNSLHFGLEFALKKVNDSDEKFYNKSPDAIISSMVQERPEDNTYARHGL